MATYAITYILDNETFTKFIKATRAAEALSKVLPKNAVLCSCVAL